MFTLHYKFTDLLDIDELGKMLEQLYNLTSMPLAIIDLEGNVLKEIGWQKICRDFHRKNRVSCEVCIACNRHYANDFLIDQSSIVYTCPRKHNNCECL